MAGISEKVSSVKIVNNGGKCLGRRCGRQTDDRLFLIHALRGSESNSDGSKIQTHGIQIGNEFQNRIICPL